MFNVLNRITCVASERERVASIIAESAQALPGCSLYAVSLDRQNENAIWVYEVWASEQHHSDSLKLDSIQQAMMAARDSITGAERIFAADSFSMAGHNL
ncbi:putative quinol monooxygenase [Hyphococcus sp.]|uniref:putative quinol monooxygenase n=1 Tax=Hyphococcus sp. TaxID=2038636 RepID=UPI0035C6C6E3